MKTDIIKYFNQDFNYLKINLYSHFRLFVGIKYNSIF